MERAEAVDTLQPAPEPDIAPGETVVRGVQASPEGLLIALQSGAPDGGRVRLIRETGAGARDQLFDASVSAEAVAGGAAALAGIFDPALRAVAVNEADRTSLSAIDLALAPAAEALMPHLSGYVAALASDGAQLALIEERLEGDALLQRVLVAGPGGGVATPDLGPLTLGESRMLTGLDLRSGAVWLCIADACGGADLATASLAEGAVPEIRISRGGHRFALNAAFTATAPHAGGLLVGTAALNDATLKLGNWGPELLHVTAEGWDLIMGQPRFSPQGLKVPASGLTPGFGGDGNWAIQALVAGEGRICAVMQRFDGPVINDRRAVVPDLRDYAGAVRLFMTEDLADWRPVAVQLPKGAGAVTSLALTATGAVLGHEGAGADVLPITHVPLAGAG